jgi:hypothetical protein
MSDSTRSEFLAELKRNALGSALRLYQRGHIKELEEIGFTVSLLEKFSNMTESQILVFCDQPSPFIEYRVNDRAMTIAMKRCSEILAENEMKDALLQQQASVDVMQHLFGMGPSDCAQRRKQLGLSESVNRGRPENLSDENARIAWDLWQSSAGMPLHERVLQIGRAGIPIKNAWSTLKSWHEEERVGDGVKPSTKSELKTDPR